MKYYLCKLRSYHTVVCFPVILGFAYSTNSSIKTGQAPVKKINNTQSLKFMILKRQITYKKLFSPLRRQLANMA